MKWPAFCLKFKIYLESSDLLYVIDSWDDAIAKGNSAKERKLKEEQAKNQKKDNVKVCSLLLNKMLNKALALIEDLTTAYNMIGRLDKQYQLYSAASTMGCLN